MWPFKQASKPQDTSDLRERVEAVEKAMRRIDEEWTEVYHKFRTLQLRTAKQVQRIEQASPDEGGTRPNGGEESQLTDHSQSSSGSSLTERQRLINQQILTRRNRRE